MGHSISLFLSFFVCLFVCLFFLCLFDVQFVCVSSICCSCSLLVGAAKKNNVFGNHTKVWCYHAKVWGRWMVRQMNHSGCHIVETHMHVRTVSWCRLVSCTQVRVLVLAGLPCVSCGTPGQHEKNLGGPKNTPPERPFCFWGVF